MSARRDLAQGLARLAALFTPPRRRDWGLAIAREIDAIEDDGEAIRWASSAAAGLFCARLRDVATSAYPYRWALAGFLLTAGGAEAFSFVYVISIRFGWAAAMDGASAEVIRAMPEWGMVSWWLWCALILTAGVQLFRARRSSAWLLAFAGTMVLARLTAVNTGLLDAPLDPPPNPVAGAVIATILAATAAAAFFLTRRPPQAIGGPKRRP